jgi:predicted nucleic acid-binding protein
VAGRHGSIAKATVKVLVDTSVWADFFNGFPSPQASVLVELIRSECEIGTCGVILAEFFQGLKRQEDVEKLEAYFLEMEYLSPREPESYLEAARLFRDLRHKGITVRSTIDCLIARLAEEHGYAILSKDRDIQLIIDSGLCSAKAVGSGSQAKHSSQL